MERVLDQQGRWRNKVVAFRMSPEEDEVLDPEKLVEACREEYCQYIILDKSREMTGNPENAGLTLVEEIDGYLIYLDPVSKAAAESFAVYYEEDDK